MATKTTYSSRSALQPDKLYMYPCLPWVQTYKRNTQWYLTVTDMLPDHSRKKPEGNLRLNPTYQNKQVRNLKVNGITRNLYRGGFIDCTGGGAYDTPYDIEEQEIWSPVSRFSAAALGASPTCAIATATRNKIREEEVSLGETLAEYRETCDMFAAAGRGIADTFRKLRKGRAPKWLIRRWKADDISAAELYTSFGVEPLIGTAFDAIERLLVPRLADPIYRRFVTFVWDEVKTTKSYNGVQYRVRWRLSKRSVVYVEFKPLGQKDFDYGKPVDMLWELTPFSFAIDYFVPVGDWLSALDAMEGVENLIGTFTQKDVYMHSGVKRWPNVKLSDPVRPGKVIEKSHQRFVWNENSYSFLPDLPHYSPSLSARRVAHSVSLIQQISSGFNWSWRKR